MDNAWLGAGVAGTISRELTALAIGANRNPSAVGPPNYVLARLAWGELNPAVADLEVTMVFRDDRLLTDDEFVHFCVEASDMCGFAQGLLLPLTQWAGYASSTPLEGTASLEHVSFGPVALERYACGPAWGLWLTNAHLDTLGGRERVLHEAPVARAESSPAGVWLELTPSMWDFSEEQLGRLNAYLAPLTPTLEQLRSVDPQWPWTQSPVESPSVEGEYADYHGTPVLVEWTSPTGDTTLPINVRFSRAPSKAAAAALDRAVRAWYSAGVQGRYDGHFHDLDGPTRIGRVLSWAVDMRSVDIQKAVDDLGRRVAGCSDRWQLPVTAIRLGVDDS